MFDPDKAIKSCSEDKLGRCKFSKLLGDTIMNYNYEESLVIGLWGKWGEGKTSIINMAIEHMEEVENTPIIIQFNPWIFSNQNQLITKFFDELMIAIKDENIVDELKSYVSRIIPPIIGLAAIIDPVRAQSIIKTAEYVNNIESEENNLESIKNKLNLLIKEKNRKIIVVIDDIDRLSDFEIRQSFQLVKLIANFPNTIYLLAFDRDVVVKALEESQENSGDEYLDKIVQIPFEVPQIYKSDLEGVLFSQIDEIIHEFNDKFDQTYWWNLYHSGLKHFFNNLRDVKRYINSLKFNFEVIKHEINPADFLAITAIQIFIPEVFQEIKANKDLFAGILDYSGRDYDSRRKQEKDLCDEIIRKSDSNPEKLKELLEYMFPRLNAIFGNTHYGREWLSTWRKELRICSPDIFETYFALSIPKGEISHYEIENILSSSNDQNSLSDSLLKLNENKKIVRFLERFEDYTQEVPKQNIGNIVAVLMDIGDIFPDTKTGFFDFGTPMKVSRIIYQLIWRFESTEERFKILKRSIEKSRNSLYIAVHKIGIEDQVHAKYDLADHPKPEEEWIVTANQLKELENLVCGKIHDWANDGRLAKHTKLVEILFNWKRWEPEEVNKFVNDMIKTDEGLIKFLSSFLSKSRSFTITDKVPKSSWTISIENIGHLAELDEIEKRIQSIASSPEFENLNKGEKLAIECFLEKMRKKN